MRFRRFKDSERNNDVKKSRRVGETPTHKDPNFSTAFRSEKLMFFGSGTSFELSSARLISSSLGELVQEFLCLLRAIREGQHLRCH